MENEKPIRLTAEEFETLLFKVYINGFELGLAAKNNQESIPYVKYLKEQFNYLMYDMGLKTK